jgi:tRNA G18 (ribose-2'-O)-methylase SpoU
MPVIPISDPDDPRIAAYRDIRERDLVGREGRFMAEGEVVLRVMAGQVRLGIDSLLLAESRLAPLGDLIARLPPEVPVFAAPQPIMNAIAGFAVHRGVMAVGRRPAPEALDSFLDRLPARALVVAAIGIANHDNIGGIFRNAAAFGAEAVLLDATSCDPLYRKAIRVSVGAALLVPFHRGASAGDLMATLAMRGFALAALSPSGGEELSRYRPGARTAVILGAEGPGLPQDVLEMTDTLRIPMAGGFDSLNVATTSGIVLHHLRHHLQLARVDAKAGEGQ